MGDGLSLDYLVAGWPSPCDRARSNHVRPVIFSKPGRAWCEPSVGFLFCAWPRLLTFRLRNS